jgi:uncharacterized FlgJ-related protein
MNSTELIIYNTAIGAGFPASFALLMIAWSKHETGDFTSKFFKQYNNLFGYSYVPGAAYQSGPGTNADNGVPIAAYSSPEMSVRENIAWVKRRQAEGKFPADLGTIKTPDQLATLLKKAGYYQDSLANYAAGLARFFMGSAGNFTIVVGGVLLIVAAYYYTKH